jgi:uncharacterized protein YkwD
MELAGQPPKLKKLLPRSTLTILFFVFPCSLLAQKPSAEEQFFFDAVNRERIARQLPPLKWNSALAEAARRHALRMAKKPLSPTSRRASPGATCRSGRRAFLRNR